MNVAIVHNGTSHLEKLVALFQNHTVSVLPSNKLNSPYLHMADVVILSGGHYFSVKNHPEFYKEQLDFIQKTTQPLVGICLGAQLIAAAFAGEITQLARPRRGFISLYIDTPPHVLQVYESHKWSVTTLPPLFTSAAESIDGYEIFSNYSKSIVGIQFHPELSDDATKKYFLNQLNII